MAIFVLSFYMYSTKYLVTELISGGYGANLLIRYQEEVKGKESRELGLSQLHVHELESFSCSKFSKFRLENWFFIFEYISGFYLAHSPLLSSPLLWAAAPVAD